LRAIGFFLAWRQKNPHGAWRPTPDLVCSLSASTKTYDFAGKLTTEKWAKRSSDDRALRDIQDLIGKDILKQEKGGARPTRL